MFQREQEMPQPGDPHHPTAYAGENQYGSVPIPHRLSRFSWLARLPFRTRQALGRKTKIHPTLKNKLQGYSPQSQAGWQSGTDLREKSDAEKWGSSGAHSPRYHSAP